MITRVSPQSDLLRTENKIQYPVPGSACGYTGTPGTVGVSKHYYTTYKWYGKNVLFIGLHLLAYPTDHTRCAEREAQAQIIQGLIMDYIALDYEVLVMGDFNDFDDETRDLNDNKPLSHTLDILKGLRGTYAGKYTLTNVATKMLQTERWTDWWDKNGDCVSSPDEFSMIDHILMTPFLLSKVEDVSVYHDYSEFCGKYNSDHYPVVVTMENPYL
jgi:exonuclease III